MKGSAKTDYACLAMMELAANYGDSQPLRIKAISERTGIPLRFLVQLMLLLKTGGLVASMRGALGGYQLARSPQSISLADILSALEKRSAPHALPERLKPSPTARALAAVWGEVQAEEQRLLENISLAELLERARQDSMNLTYQI
ncbi:MAG: Rrf2 family transcriptional regulator [Planctomycetes bacterium]|nr:Rrf2 family transcriptional regulator [Planctomycetota bacterium]